MGLVINLGTAIAFGTFVAYVAIIALIALIAVAWSRSCEVPVRVDVFREYGPEREDGSRSIGRTVATESLHRHVVLEVPTPGRIVSYTDRLGKLWPAMVSNVRRPGMPESALDLFVFNLDRAGTVEFFVEQGIGCDQWRWPIHAQPVSIEV